MLSFIFNEKLNYSLQLTIIIGVTGKSEKAMSASRVPFVFRKLYNESHYKINDFYCETAQNIEVQFIKTSTIMIWMDK